MSSLFKCCVGKQSRPPPKDQAPKDKPQEEEPEVPEPVDTLAPTLKPAPNFQAKKDCEDLREAMKGVGTNEAGLNVVLCRRSLAQRAEVEKAYREVFQKELETKIIDETSGTYKKMLLRLLKTQPSEMTAFELNEAIKGEGYDAWGLIEIVCTARRNAELLELKQTYQKLFENKSLEQALGVEVKDAFKDFLLKLLAANRPEKGKFRSQVDGDAKALHEAIAKKDAKPFVEILGTRRFAHLHAILEAYKRDFKAELLDAVKKAQFPQKEFHDAVIAFVMSLQKKPAYFAERLRAAFSLDEAAKRDTALTRLLVWRVEIDLEAIKSEYAKLYGHPLATDITEKCEGDFKDGVLVLIGN